MSAVLGVIQMGRISEILGRRACVAQMCRERLSKIDRISLPHMVPEVDFMNRLVYVIRVGCVEAAPEARSAVCDHVMARFQEVGIGSRSYFTLMYLQPFYCRQFGQREGDFAGAKRAGLMSVAMPLRNKITEDEVDCVT